MDPLAALLSERPPQQLSVTELRSRIALLEDAARASRAELESRTGLDALSKLSGDEQGIILGQLRNTLEPRPVMYFSSASKELRALLTPAVQRELKDDYEEATALCLKVGMRDCKELREAWEIHWYDKGLSGCLLYTSPRPRDRG